jgi:hypothetical protein
LFTTRTLSLSLVVIYAPPTPTDRPYCPLYIFCPGPRLCPRTLSKFLFLGLCKVFDRLVAGNSISSSTPPIYVPNPPGSTMARLSSDETNELRASSLTSIINHPSFSPRGARSLTLFLPIAEAQLDLRLPKRPFGHFPALSTMTTLETLAGEQGVCIRNAQGPRTQHVPMFRFSFALDSLIHVLRPWPALDTPTTEPTLAPNHRSLRSYPQSSP